MLRGEVWLQKTDGEFLNYEMTTLTLLTLIKIYLDTWIMGFCHVAHKKMKNHKADCKIIIAYAILERTDPLLNIWRIKKENLMWKY